jgi:hypothetical protein
MLLPILLQGQGNNLAQALAPVLGPGKQVKVYGFNVYADDYALRTFLFRLRHPDSFLLETIII